MSYTSLLTAIENFRRVYGDHPKFATTVGSLMDAVGLVKQAAPPSPGLRDSVLTGRYLQHKQMTFNPAGQEPQPRAEMPGDSQAGVEAVGDSRHQGARGTRPGQLYSRSYSAGRP